MGIFDQARSFLGKVVAGTGQALSQRLGSGANVRIGGGQGLGARIAGRNEPYFTNVPPPPPPPPRPPVRPPARPGAPSPAAPPPGQAPEQRQEPQQPFQVPSVQEYVPSAEDRAREAAEERERVQQEKMQRFGQLITQLRSDVETYLRERKPITELFQEELGKQGVEGKRQALSTLEAEGTKLGTQLETLPGEEIARRKESGMLSAAAERRIRALEERPIREQLLKVTGAKETERVGLERAYQLLDKMLDLQREQEKRGAEPLEYRLKGAEEQFGLEGKGFKSQIDSIASQLSGFNKDREAKLKEYEATVDAGLKLTMAQQKEAADLKKLELQHLNTMEQIAARRKGQASDVDKTEEIQEMESRIAAGATKDQLVDEFVATGRLDIATVEKQLDKYSSIISTAEEGGGGTPI